MLRVSPPTSVKPVNNLICCKTGLIWVMKRTTTLFNSFCGNVARQVARCLLPVCPSLKGRARHTPQSDTCLSKHVPKAKFLTGWYVASTEWLLYIRGPDTNCRWEKEWASSLSLRQRSGLNSNYKGSLKYFSERVVAFIFYLSSRISYMTDQGDSNFEYYRDVYVQSS